MIRAAWVALLLAAATDPATAGDFASGVDLERRNALLEERVRKLEAGAMAEEVERYLADYPAQPFTAEGASSLLPGGLRLKISGEARIREEVQHRLYAPMDPAGSRSLDFAHMRTRLRFDIDVDDNLGVVVELQDVRILGEGGSTTADAEGLDLKRATIVVRRIGGHPVTVEAGRFVMAYGDQRHIGHLEWFDQGRTYDGARVAWAPDSLFVDLFAVRVRETVVPDDDQTLLGLYGGTKGWRSWLDGEAYVLVLSDTKPAAGELGPGDTLFFTLGLRLAGKQEGWDYALEISFQTGERNGDDLSAFAFAWKGGRTFTEAPGTPRAGLEIDFATGDDDPTDGKNRQFQTLFPTNHIHYGFADLLGWSNLLDLRVSLSARPREKVLLTLDFHHFRRVEERGAWINAGGALIRPGAAGTSSHLGDEIDFTVTWTPKKSLTILFGWSLFLPGGFVAQTGADPTARFLYLEIRVTF
ncbi:MAG: alginate export family protein [Planctomycetaceae bacterium]